MKIVCPKCKKILGSTTDRLVSAETCSECSFPIKSLRGVPILYENENFEELDQLEEASTLPVQNSEELKIPFIQEALASGEWVLELGAGVDVCKNPKLVKTDAFLYSTDLHCLADAHSLPFADNSFGYVYSLAVFEHLHSPWIAAEEIFRVLKPGGKVYVLTAFMQHMHGYPNHYFNMTLSGLKQIFKDFELKSLRPSQWSSFNEIMYILLDYANFINAGSSNLLSSEDINELNQCVDKICKINSKVDKEALEKGDFALDGNWAKIAPAVELVAKKGSENRTLKRGN